MQRFVIRWSGLPGGEAVNIVHSNGTLPGDAQSFANDIRNTLSTLALGFVQGTSVQVDELVPTINVATGQATAFTAIDTEPVEGGAVNEFLPSNAMLLVRFATADVRNGRRVQGRLFLPGLAEGNNLDGRPNQSTRTDVQAAFSTLLNGGAGATLSVYSRPDPGGSNGAESVVTGVSVWEQWAQLGRRRS